MADKGKKRKAFDVPVISDLEEVIEVTPVFDRLKKTQKQALTTKTSAKSTISQDKSNTECSVLVASHKIPGMKSVNNPQTSDQSEFSEKEERETVHVGRNFMETFAFIEKTKHYEEPKPSKIASNVTETESSESNTEKELLVKSSKPNAIIINQRQKGNPVLKFFQNVPWEYGDIIPDYVMGPRMCALFLSLRYHNFNPDYIHDRLKQLGNRYELRVLLVQVDILKVRHLSIQNSTCAKDSKHQHSAEEAARYIEMYKVYENKPPDVLQGQTSTDYLSKLTDCLTTVKSVNKTDTVTLLSTFESLENIISASADEISLCPGFGPQKAKRLHDAFHQPFIASKRTQEKHNRKGSKS